MEDLVLGIDLGNANVKTSAGIIFKARTKVGASAINNDDTIVKYDGITYTVGTDEGSLNISNKKYKKTHYKVCVLTAIAKSTKEKVINTKIVVGVPIENFNNKILLEDMKKEILNWGAEKITVNGEEKIINVNDVAVFAESAVVFTNREKFKNEKTLVLDFGGSTVDVSYWVGLRQENSRTYKQGMISLYEDMAKIINDKFNSELRGYQVVNLIGEKKAIIKQEEVDISFVHSVVENYLDGLLSYVNQYFTVDNADSIQLIGGGAIQLGKYLLEEYDKAEIVPSAEFANVLTYQKAGEMMWIK